MRIEYTIAAAKPTALYGLVLEPYDVFVSGDVAVVAIDLDADDHEWHRLEDAPPAPGAYDLLVARVGDMAQQVEATWDGKAWSEPAAAATEAGWRAMSWRRGAKDRGEASAHKRLAAALAELGEVAGIRVVDQAEGPTVEDLARVAKLEGAKDYAAAEAIELAAIAVESDPVVEVKP